MPIIAVLFQGQLCVHTKCSVHTFGLWSRIPPGKGGRALCEGLYDIR